MAGEKLYTGSIPPKPPNAPKWNAGDSLGVKIQKMLQGFIHNVILDWVEFFAELSVQIFDSSMKILRPGMARMFDPYLAWFQSQPWVTPEIKSMIQRVRDERGEAAAGAIFGILIGVFTQIISGMIAPMSRRLEHATEMIVRSYVPDANLVAVMQRRGFIKGEASAEAWGHAGVPAEMIDILNKLSENLPSVGEALEFYRRGLYGDGDFNKVLSDLLISPENIKRYKELALNIPPVSDLITFMVREAFDDSVSQRFSYDEGYPEQINQFLPKVGLSPEWGKRYWRAHWTLPSPTMAYEMLHRGILSQSDMEALLKTADYPKFWRDKLIAMSYSNYTRVDIRRMYQAGVLTEPDVFKAYKDIGYNDERARKLTEFTVRLVSNEERDLTKAEITTMYQDGLIDRSTLTSNLVKMGYDSQEAESLAVLADYNIAKSQRADAVNYAHERFAAGVIDEGATRTALSSAGIRPLGVDRYLLQWSRDKEQAETLPTIKEAKELYFADFISRDELIGVYRRRLYSQKWIDIFMRAVDKEREGE